MINLCVYKDIFGIPKKGFHKYRIFNIAIVDLLLTIIFLQLRQNKDINIMGMVRNIKQKYTNNKIKSYNIYAVILQKTNLLYSDSYYNGRNILLFLSLYYILFTISIWTVNSKQI